MNEINTQRKNPPRTASKRHKVVVSVLAAITLGIVASAIPDTSRFIVRMLDRKVDLDDAQTAAIEQIIAASKAEGSELRAELGSMRKEITDTIQANGYVEDQVRITVESHSTQMVDLMMLRIRMMADIYAQLTPEQQVRVKDFMNNFGSRGSGPGPRSHRPASAPPADNQ